MLDPVIIRKIREEERRRRERESVQIPLYYEPPPPDHYPQRPIKPEDEERSGGTVIEIDL